MAADANAANDDHPEAVDQTFPDDISWTRATGAAGAPVRANAIYRLRLNAGAPGDLLAAPIDIRPANIARGEAILEGAWRFDQDRLSLRPDASPWTLDFPSLHFTDRIHRFHWLRDVIAAAPNEGAYARRLVSDWIVKFGKWDPFAWRIDVTADRLVNWLAAGPDLIDGLDENGRAAVLESLLRQARHLLASSQACPSPNAQARAATALCLAGAALPDQDKMLETGLARLEDVSKSHLLADGGHASRAPETLGERLMDFHMVEDLLLRLARPAPRFLSNAQSRMANMLRFLSTPDGGYLAVNGGGDGGNGLAAAALGPHGTAGGRFSFARLSGYQRIEAEDLTVYMDTGGAPEPMFGGQAHAGCLSIAVYDGPDPLIVACGSNADATPDLREAVRRTAAHSTLCLEDTDSAAFGMDAETGRHAPTGPEAVSARRLEENDQFLLEGQHGGWRARHGLIHRRRLYVAKNGERITGEDALSRPMSEAAEAIEGRAPYALRFHLHPDVELAPGPDPKTLYLGLPERRIVWRFKCDADVTSEPSIYAAGLDRRRTRQIVVAGSADLLSDGAEAPNRVRWALSRAETPE